MASLHDVRYADKPMAVVGWEYSGAFQAGERQRHLCGPVAPPLPLDVWGNS